MSGARSVIAARASPGAAHLDYARLLLGQPPAPGKLPPVAQLEATLRALGLNAHHRVIAYDDAGNGRASRLLWTLEALGHTNFSLLNGGLAAWLGAGCPTESAAESTVESAAASTAESTHESTTAVDSINAPPGDFTARLNDTVIADKAFVLAALDNPDIQLLDARSPEEFNGLKSQSARRGRIPGAVNLNWLDTIDRANHLRFKPAPELEAMLAARGLERDRETITYCQTHHRSSHAFMMLRHLGFARVRGYPGSWSEWGNDPDTPIE